MHEVIDKGYTSILLLHRICPGKDMADMSLFITIAIVVATLNISKARDASGKEIIPVHTMSNGIIRLVRLFSFEFLGSFRN